jgi:hypothetical protein
MEGKSIALPEQTGIQDGKEKIVSDRVDAGWVPSHGNETAVEIEAAAVVPKIVFADRLILVNAIVRKRSGMLVEMAPGGKLDPQQPILILKFEVFRETKITQR